MITTILDPDIPVTEIIRLYRQRSEIETSFLELKSTILGGRVLRAKTPDGVDQEVYTLLGTYQAPRTAIADATTGRPRPRSRPKQLHHRPQRRPRPARRSHRRDHRDRIGVIGRHVLDNRRPARQLRTNPRVVKRAISKFVANTATGRVRAPRLQAAITIKIIARVDP